jgi:hypothetical protein
MYIKFCNSTQTDKNYLQKFIGGKLNFLPSALKGKLANEELAKPILFSYKSANIQKKMIPLQKLVKEE